MKQRLYQLILIALSLWFGFGSTAYALTTEHLQQVQYDATYYNSGSTRNSTTPCVANGPTLTGNDNPQKAFNYLVGQGLQPFQAAGIVGNLMWESGGVDPTADERLGHAHTPTPGVGFGIAQWTYPSRQQGLLTLAKQMAPLGVDTMDVQLAYLWDELTGKPPASDYSSSLAAVKASANVSDATTVFMRIYESPNAALAHLAERISNATQVLAKYGNGAPGGGGGGGCPISTGGANGDKIVQIALAQVGTHEVPMGSNGGPACMYQGSGCPQAWCADFISWVYKQAGVPFTTGADGGWRIAGAAALANWFGHNNPNGNGIWINNPRHPIPVNDPSAPKPGDVVYYPAGDGHVNIVVSYDGTTVKTVGGNQGDAVNTIAFDVFASAAGWGRLK